ncbi:phosphotransferase system, mannose fructose-specific component IIB [Pediococcus inopinatus]|nr:phosphotransferase system, mannose fructose-specific component IIB [Pediococcus inopinatus]
MKICLARVDSRLLHGQIATGWAKSVKPNRILVVSDSVANDELRKMLIVQAAPLGVNTNVLTIDKMLRIYADDRFDAFKVLLLTETVQDMLRLVHGGMDFKELGIDIGSLAFSEGMTMLNDSIAVGPEEISTIRSLHDAGLQVFAQKIPNDGKKDMITMLAKNKL